MSQPIYEPTPAPPVRRLIRNPDDKIVAGVLGGLAYYLGVDATVLRIAFVVAAVLGFGTAVIAYLAAWALVPMGVRVETPAAG
ncbi:MAG: PspC domain-containing protein [Nocardioidaceae bacterium]